VLDDKLASVAEASGAVPSTLTLQQTCLSTPSPRTSKTSAHKHFDLNGVISQIYNFIGITSTALTFSTSVSSETSSDFMTRTYLPLSSPSPLPGKPPAIDFSWNLSRYLVTTCCLYACQ
jgi:hypothetical protein